MIQRILQKVIAKINLRATIICLYIFTNTLLTQGQSVGIGTSTPNSKAILDISSTTKGILIPSMTTAERLAIISPPNGLMVYDSDRKEFYHSTGTAWSPILNGEYWSRGIATRDRIGNSTDSVGIGTLSPTAKLDIRGNVRIVDGNEADGKVLTSDVNGMANWQNAAYSSNDRVLVKFSGFGADSVMTFPSVVYANGTGITYSPILKRFTINTSGLYRFSGAMALPNLLYAASATFLTSLIEFDNNLLYLGSTRHTEEPSNPGAVLGRLPFSFTADFYLTAGTIVYIKLIGYPASTGSATLRNSYISVYLINQ